MKKIFNINCEMEAVPEDPDATVEMVEAETSTGVSDRTAECLGLLVFQGVPAPFTEFSR